MTTKELQALAAELGVVIRERLADERARGDELAGRVEALERRLAEIEEHVGPPERTLP